jgi:hypothetical protein
MLAQSAALLVLGVPGLFSSTGDSLALGTLALSPLQTAGLGLLMLALIVGYVATLVVSLRQEATIWYENPEGRVEISIGAVEDFVRRVAVDFPEIKESARQSRKQGRIKVVSRVAVWTGSTIPGPDAEAAARHQGENPERAGHRGRVERGSEHHENPVARGRQGRRAHEASEDSAPIGVPNSKDR